MEVQEGIKVPSFVFNNTIVSNGPNLGIFENQYRVDLFVNNICAQYYVDGHIHIMNGRLYSVSILI